MKHRGTAVVGALLLAAVASTRSTNSADGAERRRGKVAVLDVDSGLAAFAGTRHGTVVLLHEVREGDAVVAVRRLEIALDGTTVGDVTTPLPAGFAWSAHFPFRNHSDDAFAASADVDTDGSAVLNDTKEVRLLAADGALSAPLLPTNPAWTVRLRGGFVHLLEPVAGSKFRGTYVWEGFRPDGTRVGPSEPLDPSPAVKALVDDQPSGTQDSLRIEAVTISFDGRADGSADVVVRTLLPQPAFPNNHFVWSESWLYRIDTTGAAHPVPGPQPLSIGSQTSDWASYPRVHSAAGGTTWCVDDFEDLGGHSSIVTSGSPLDPDALAVELRTSSASGVDGSGRLVLLGLSDRFRTGDWETDRTRVTWSSFTASPGAPPQVRTRRIRDAGRGRAIERSVARGSRCAAVAPDGSSLFVCPASRGDGTDPDSLFATLIDPRGRALHRAAIDAPDYGDAWRAPRVVACGDLGFAFAWQAAAGAEDPDRAPVRLALVTRR